MGLTYVGLESEDQMVAHAGLQIAYVSSMV